MMNLAEAINMTRRRGEGEYAFLRSYIVGACPDGVRALRLIDAERMVRRRRRGYNLVKRENQRFGFVYYVRYSHGGKTLPSKWNTHTNKLEEAERFAVQNKERLVSQYLKKHDGKLYSILEGFYRAGSPALAREERRGRKVTDERRRVCERIITKRFIPYLKERGIGSFEEVTTRVLVGFQDRLLTELKPQTVNNSLSPVKRVFGYLAREGFIESDPCRDLPCITVRKDELNARGCHEAGKIKGAFSQVWESEEGRLLCEVIYTTGMRNSEIARIRKSDIEEIGGCHFIKVRRSKTENGKRLCPLHEKVFRELERYAAGKGDDDPIFDGKGIIYNQANAELGRRVGMSAQALEEERITFYSGRHFWKTLMNMGGLGEDAEEFFMGHVVSSDVKKLYNHRDKQGQGMMVRKARKAFGILDRYVL